MNILIIGSGAREQAIMKACHRSSHQPTLYGYGTHTNPGIISYTKEYRIGDICDTHQISSYARQKNIAFVIIGPEAPLEAGLADALWEINIPVIGPVKQLAQLETSKSFTRNLLEKYHIPGSGEFKAFDQLENVKEFLTHLGEGNYVIKADGLMGGKGVKVAGDHLHSIQEAYAFCESLCLQQQHFMIEEKWIGQEFSLLCFSDGNTLIPMPLVQDHKRAFADDKGPNTGGMGSYSDANHLLPFLTQKDYEHAQHINQLVLSALKQEYPHDSYQGILYSSFIATQDGIKLIEYNARFGDPEAMNLLAILETDFVDVCEAIIHQKLHELSITFSSLATVCKYAVPHGYPDDPIKNTLMDLSSVMDVDALYFGAVNKLDGKYYATGSRAIAAVGIGKTISEAEKIAEQQINQIKGELFHRADIGTDALIQKRIAHMKSLRPCLSE